MQKFVGLVAVVATVSLPVAVAAYPLSAWAQTQGMERREGRRDTRQVSREVKHECNASNAGSRSDCRQVKREVKQEGRQIRASGGTTTTTRR